MPNPGLSDTSETAASVRARKANDRADEAVTLIACLTPTHKCERT